MTKKVLWENDSSFFHSTFFLEFLRIEHVEAQGFGEDPEDPFRQGQILMAKRTDPGWTILFPMAEAIIIERGSVLSHSAVIAREMGIPLVVGVRGLTDQVHDGDKVRVDGINGTIEVIERHQHGSEV